MAKCIQNESSAYIGIGKLSVQLATIASIEIIVCFFRMILFFLDAFRRRVLSVVLL